MEICWFTENYPPNKGGMARSCDRLIFQLRKYYTVHIFHFTNKFPAFFSEANVGGTYTAVPVYEDSAHTLNVLWAFLQQQKSVKKADVLVSFGSHLCLRGLPAISQWLDTPLLTCLRGNDFDTAVFSPKRQFLLYALEQSAAIACVTSEKVNRIHTLTDPKKVYFTPNSISLPDWEILESDIRLAQQYKCNVPAGLTCLGFVGYLKQKKGIDFFITSLLKSSVSKKVHLYFVGELDVEIILALQKHEISYSLVTPNSQTELMAHYLAFDAIAIPSIYDGMPNVLFEAAALKVPVIASKAGGITDVLTSETGYLFDTLSESSLIETLEDFMTISEETKQLKSEKLHQLIATEFTPETEIQHYLTIFNQLKK